jgi:hypothetical protein
MREGDLEIRAAMTDWFAVELTRAGHSWVLLSGTLGERLRLAIRATKDVLRRKAAFAAPVDEAAAAAPAAPGTS